MDDICWANEIGIHMWSQHETEPSAPNLIWYTCKFCGKDHIEVVPSE